MAVKITFNSAAELWDSNELETNFHEIWNKIHTSSFQELFWKCHLDDINRFFQAFTVGLKVHVMS